MTLCQLGMHRWKFMFGNPGGHRYFECKRCGVRSVRLALAGYQPIDNWWLTRVRGKPLTIPPPGRKAA